MSRRVLDAAPAKQPLSLLLLLTCISKRSALLSLQILSISNLRRELHILVLRYRQILLLERLFPTLCHLVHFLPASYKFIGRHRRRQGQE